jgi:trimeric autotransporter adhesin
MNTRSTVFLAVLLLLMLPTVAQVPGILGYQGRVTVNGTGFTGMGQFKFALVNAAGTTSFWSNDETSNAGAQPTAAVSLTVSNGLYSVLLGDTTLTNMTAVPASVFTNADVRLRVWFNDGANGWLQLAPDQRLAATGYAQMAAAVADGAITSSKLASGLTLGGTASLSGSLSMPATSGPALGAISQNGGSLLHTYGTDSLFLGGGAGNFTFTGIRNTGIGDEVLMALTTGSGNTAVGDDALKSNTTGNYNTAVGEGSMELNISGPNNIAVGLNALRTNSSGSSNVAVGTEAMKLNTTGGNNTAVGYLALFNNTTAGGNLAVGAQALFKNVTTAGNTAVGYYALRENTGPNNTALGYQALVNNTTGSNNTAIGLDALLANSTGINCVAVGSFALNANTTAADNVAVGVQSLFRNTMGVGNTATGTYSLFNNLTGSSNSALGTYALAANTSGNNNTALGNGALSGNATASDNTAVGYQAMQTNSIGVSNTAVGLDAMMSNTSGNNNAAFGKNALFANTSGGGNIALGWESGKNLTTGSNNIMIGNLGVAAEAATIRIGTDGTHTRTFISGISGVTSSGGAQVFINSSGRLGTTTSSRRFKHGIVDMGPTSEMILGLRPVTFRYKEELDPDQLPQFGLIAEEVARIHPLLVVRDEKGDIQSVRYEQVNAMLLNEFLKEHHRGEKRDAEIENLKHQLQAMEARELALEIRERDLEKRLQKIESVLNGNSNPETDH